MTSLRGTEEWLANYQRRGLRSGDVTSVRLVLPMPPSVNAFGANGHRGGRKTEAYKVFMAVVAATVRDAGNPRIEGRLSVDISVVPPDKRVRDLDNMQQAVLNSLKKLVYDDDGQVDDLRIRRMPCVPGEGSATVVITRMAGA